ncbi:hypothetical protein [Roseovarius autotrophicus]|nr:hypothetical protein [Roseovarius autotrophicus]MBE0453461.1 hypothetical protein [Roseovarius sp.]
MKQRWLKSVVKHSTDAAPALPYHRDARQTRRQSQLFELLRSLKTA